MKNKRILVVYPHNFFAHRMGIDSRYYELMKYFKSRNFSVDVLSVENFESSWKNQDPKEENLIDELFLYDFAADKGSVKKNCKRFFRRFLKGKSAGTIIFEQLPDYAFPGMKKKFDEILSRKQYDFILISYIHWANLLETRDSYRSKLILDLSDFTTLNLNDMTGGKIHAGALLEEEIRRVNLFDEVLCISAEEKWFFSQFAKNPCFTYIPFFMKKNTRRVAPATQDVNKRCSLSEKISSQKNKISAHSSTGKTGGKKEFDILFIGSGNVFNKQGMDWFFEKVYPLLSRSLQILIVGNITSHVPAHENVKCVPFVPEVDDVYHKARISICPLLGGTGIKIKVIEALSYNLPVVTTSKSVVGFPSKRHNGCLIADTPEEFAGHISGLLTDKSLYDGQNKLAGICFEENFEESIICERLDRVFLSL
ncbi:glycosyltransferase [Acidobacteriota bacterium]